ncbi:hypothetical protein NA57DRAFT_40329 [Rhizodiscina lignyota]|uniref:CSN8/PSMD8/EIF3K domain-containing protein n=1 Tax=Rhizodiscina lignyota TaxID=1504668 RepID=A0A9P4IEA6_9PEZI|nr:hypothetical protein NA57DRAFT_40329 [Rhizodiscina lignyota]
MATQQRPASSGRRGPSGAWSRLKTPPQDPLEAYGLPSKGETRLNDFKVQEVYYNRIVERYMKFCANAKNGDELDRHFATLSISGLAASKYASQPPASSTPTTLPPLSATKLNPSSSNAATPSIPSPELQLILSATRKLREAIVSSHRTDSFAQRCYVFIIRAAILARAWESYHPALLYLLRTIHPLTPLADSELKELVGYRVLDEACRIGDLGEAHKTRVAFSVRYGWKKDDCKLRRVDVVLRALVHDDWTTFWRMRRAVDGYQRRLMEWAEDGMRVHALKCLGRSYFSAERGYVERCTGTEWRELVRQGVGWELQSDGETVVIRRVKAKGIGGVGGSSGG